MVCAACSGSQVFLRPAFTSNISIALVTALEERWGSVRKLTHDRSDAQISQAEGKVAPEKQKDFVLVQRSRTSKQGLRRQPASCNRMSTSCSSPTNVHGRRAALLGIFRRPGMQEKAPWVSHEDPERETSWNAERCLPPLLLLTARHCELQRTRGSETGDCPVSRHAWSDLCFLQLCV